MELEHERIARVGVNNSRDALRLQLETLVDHAEELHIEIVERGQLVLFVVDMNEADRRALVSHRSRPVVAIDSLLRVAGVRCARRFQLVLSGEGEVLSAQRVALPVGGEVGFESGGLRVRHLD